MTRTHTADVGTEHARGSKTLNGYVLTLKDGDGAVGSTFFLTYQHALAHFAAERGAIALSDEDWPRFEAWLRADPHVKLSPATCTVEWNDERHTSAT